MSNPAPGKLMWKLFQGDPETVVDEANAFLDAHDMQRFPVAQATHTWHDDGKRLAILLTIAAPMGAGRPDIAIAKMNGQPH